MPTKAFVYWLYDDSCVCYWRHGYIGVTVDWPRRLWRHRCESPFLPARFDGRVLFTGTVKRCLALERQLRPTSGIAWNRLPGGLGGHATKGVPKSPEHREKIRQAALRRWANATPVELEQQSEAVKRGLKHVDRSGKKNSRFGKPMSEETKQKIRDKIIERGGHAGERNANYRHGRYVEED